MYYYVEFLRALRAMRVIFIILGALAACAIGFRIYLIGSHTPDDVAVALEQSPTAHVTRTTLADGTLESRVEDPQQGISAVIDRKNGHLKIVVREPRAAYRAQSNKMITINNDHEQVVDAPGGVRATIEYSSGDNKFDLSVLFAASMIVSLVTATMLGAPLAKENAGHLELTWTKPVSRSQFAWAAIAVDLVTIVLSQIATAIVVILCALLYFVPQIVVGSVVLGGIGLVAPLAWYALLTTVSASVKQGPGLAIGLGWVCAILVAGIAHGTAQTQNSIGMAVHIVTQALAYLDPIAYTSFSDGGLVANGVVKTATEAFFALCALLVVYLIAAVLQWRRVEA